AILSECLTGRPPYGGATYEQVIINICMKDAEDVRMHNPGVPEGIAQVIQKALARERDARFASAREFLDALATATGGLVSSRPGRGSADEFASLSSRRSSGPNVIRSDPPPGPNGFAPTVEVHPAGTSKVGWSTSGKAVAKRERRRFAMVAVGALAIGSVGALLVLREKGIGRSEPTKAVVAAPVPAREIALRLTSKAANARFFVNDAELPGGVLKGHPGDTRLVWVKTDGMQPFAKEVSLHEGGPASIELDPPEGEAAAATAPQVVPAGDASSAASAEPAKPPPVHVGGHVPIRHPPPGKPEPPATAVHVTPPPPQGTGIAGGLQLKKD
ncbi:MAG TPA: serine/threonine protein kinase, partial [Minicystis sp.]|nr:serine/threonine protein kinase [Minicystis sp.]